MTYDDMSRVYVLWAGMYQGGDRHLQCPCGEFDSHPVHHFFVDGIDIMCIVIFVLLKWARISVGREAALQAEGRRFEPCRVHHFMLG